MQRTEYRKTGDGAEITRITSVDKVVEVPGFIDGLPVASIGPRFLNESHQGRTVRIPSSVIRIDQEAFEGSTGISRIEYGGNVETFSGFRLVAPCDCSLVFGDGYSFEFKGGFPMGFPEFDKAMRGFGSGLTLETALDRLRRPVGLSKDDEDWYRRFVSDRIMPRAERAASSNDASALRELISAGTMTVEDLRRLLERSARSGRVAVTSMLMSEISSRSS
ncbi:MAG: hypothetical protein IKH98_03575 [Candidatus Methanomethylophilaceae archaeon]|jgi:hypothetical protein|nr:hypothetical protein [Candidatus Methanomethylophilaceae archaeon]